MISVPLKKMLARRSLPSLMTRISVDWKKIFICLLLFVSANAFGMRGGIKGIARAAKPNLIILRAYSLKPGAAATIRESVTRLRKCIQRLEDEIADMSDKDIEERFTLAIEDFMKNVVMPAVEPNKSNLPIKISESLPFKYINPEAEARKAYKEIMAAAAKRNID
jgi:hypothetical protein